MSIIDLQKENIKNLSPYSSARDEFKGKASVFIDANENPYENGINRYPDPTHSQFVKTILKKYNVLKKNIIIGNGSDEIIDLVFKSFCEPNKDNIMLFEPSYGMYKVLADTYGVKTLSSKLDNNFDIDLDNFFEVYNNRTKVIFICSPNNPTGNLLSKNKIIEILENTNSIVFVDEAYIQFSSKKGVLDLINKYEKLIVSHTLSKFYGMAGLRIGLGFANKKFIDILYKVKLPYNISNFVLEEAEERLEDDFYINKSFSIIKSRKKLVKDLYKYSFIEKVFLSEANFLLIKFKNANKVFNFLKQEGIIVRDRTKLYNCQNCLRISIGTEFQNKILLNSLEKYKE